nr:MAG TPA: hypothetical protein [Caudoviricetes sp.]
MTDSTQSLVSFIITQNEYLSRHLIGCLFCAKKR